MGHKSSVTGVCVRRADTDETPRENGKGGPPDSLQKLGDARKTLPREPPGGTQPCRPISDDRLWSFVTEAMGNGRASKQISLTMNVEEDSRHRS